MAYHIDHVQPKYDRLRGQKSKATREHLHSFLREHSRPFRTPIIPMAFTTINPEWWAEFLDAVSPVLDAQGLVLAESKQHNSFFLQLADSTDPASAAIAEYADELQHGIMHCSDTDTENPSFVLKMLTDFAVLASESRAASQQMLEKYPPQANDCSKDYNPARRSTPEYTARLLMLRVHASPTFAGTWPAGTSKAGQPNLSKDNLRLAACELHRQVLCEAEREPASAELAWLVSAGEDMMEALEGDPGFGAMKDALHVWYVHWYNAKHAELESGSDNLYWEDAESGSESDE